MNSLSHQIISTPFGQLIIVATQTAITEAKFTTVEPKNSVRENTPLIIRASQQLNEYFSQKRFEFDLPIEPKGTPFQREAWSELLKVPYGKTINYGFQAKQLGKPNASRAVGAANGKNPIAIIIPCHRVIGANGSLTGYAGGLRIKEKLLHLESSRTDV